jgi:hypothetical protein
MTKANTQPKPHDLDEAIRLRILDRAKAINSELLTRLSVAAEDLDAGRHRAALGGIDGVERQIDTMRSLLLLLP